jgi:Tol biopolymer transport system component
VNRIGLDGLLKIGFDTRMLIRVRLALLVACLAPLILPVGRSGASEAAQSVTYVHGPSIYAISTKAGRPRLVVRGKEVAADYSQSTYYYDPAWSRDGRRLAVTVEQDRSSEVVVVRPKPQLHVPGGFSPFSEQPSWAPDGRRLVLVGVQFGDPYRVGGLYVSSPGSRSRRELTDESLDPAGTHDGSPAWSPDGSLIAFARVKGRGPLRLYVIQPDGRNLKWLTRSFGENPSWSPDSKRVVFDDRRRIAVIDVDGRNLTYLTRGPGDTDPSWSPDGRTVAFIRDKDLWVMDASGKNARLLVKDASQPAWRPG